MRTYLMQFIILHLFLIGIGIHSVYSQSTLNSTQKKHKTVGDVLVVAVPALALGSTFLWKDDTNSTIQFSKTLVGTLALSYGLKLIIHKPRPNNENNNSFPSAHTSVAFASAGFIHERYGWKFGVPAYVLASYVGYSRIKAKKHDGWDVGVGALIGIGMSHLFTQVYQPHKPLNLSSSIVQGYPLLGVNFKF
jgi:membrane-associated phospholipid phosphatase